MYERGEREPSDEIKKQMAVFFNCTVDYLIGKSDIKNELSQDIIMKMNTVYSSIPDKNRALLGAYEVANNLIVINGDNLSEEDIEKIKEYAELLRGKSKKN